MEVLTEGERLKGARYNHNKMMVQGYAGHNRSDCLDKKQEDNKTLKEDAVYKQFSYLSGYSLQKCKAPTY